MGNIEPEVWSKFQKRRGQILLKGTGKSLDGSTVSSETEMVLPFLLKD